MYKRQGRHGLRYGVRRSSVFRPSNHIQAPRAAASARCCGRVHNSVAVARRALPNTGEAEPEGISPGAAISDAPPWTMRKLPRGSPSIGRNVEGKRATSEKSRSQHVENLNTAERGEEAWGFRRGRARVCDARVERVEIATTARASRGLIARIAIVLARSRFREFHRVINALLLALRATAHLGARRLRPPRSRPRPPRSRSCRQRARRRRWARPRRPGPPRPASAARKALG